MDGEYGHQHLLDSLQSLDQQQKVAEWQVSAEFIQSEDSDHNNTPDSESVLSDQLKPEPPEPSQSRSSKPKNPLKNIRNFLSSKTSSGNSKGKEAASVKDKSSTSNTSKTSRGQKDTSDAKAAKTQASVKADSKTKAKTQVKSKSTKVSTNGEYQASKRTSNKVQRSQTFSVKPAVDESSSLQRSGSLRKKSRGTAGGTVFDRLYPSHGMPHDHHHSVGSPQKTPGSALSSRRSSGNWSTARSIASDRGSLTSDRRSNASSLSREMSPDSGASGEKAVIRSPLRQRQIITRTSDSRVSGSSDRSTEQRVNSPLGSPDESADKPSTPQLIDRKYLSKRQGQASQLSQQTLSAWAKATDRFSTRSNMVSHSPSLGRHHVTTQDLEGKDIISKPKFERFKATRTSMREARTWSGRVLKQKTDCIEEVPAISTQRVKKTHPSPKEGDEHKSRTSKPSTKQNGTTGQSKPSKQNTVTSHNTAFTRDTKVLANDKIKQVPTTKLNSDTLKTEKLMEKNKSSPAQKKGLGRKRDSEKLKTHSHSLDDKEAETRSPVSGTHSVSVTPEETDLQDHTGLSNQTESPDSSCHINGPVITNGYLDHELPTSDTISQPSEHAEPDSSAAYMEQLQQFSRAIGDLVTNNDKDSESLANRTKTDTSPNYIEIPVEKSSDSLKPSDNMVGDPSDAEATHTNSTNCDNGINGEPVKRELVEQVAGQDTVLGVRKTIVHSETLQISDTGDSSHLSRSSCRIPNTSPGKERRKKIAGESETKTPVNTGATRDINLLKNRFESANNEEKEQLMQRPRNPHRQSLAAERWNSKHGATDSSKDNTGKVPSQKVIGNIRTLGFNAEHSKKEDLDVQSSGSKDVASRWLSKHGSEEERQQHVKHGVNVKQHGKYEDNITEKTTDKSVLQSMSSDSSVTRQPDPNQTLQSVSYISGGEDSAFEDQCSVASNSSVTKRGTLHSASSDTSARPKKQPPPVPKKPFIKQKQTDDGNKRDSGLVSEEKNIQQEEGINKRIRRRVDKQEVVTSISVTKDKEKVLDTDVFTEETDVNSWPDSKKPAAEIRKLDTTDQSGKNKSQDVPVVSRERAKQEKTGKCSSNVETNEFKFDNKNKLKMDTVKAEQSLVKDNTDNLDKSQSYNRFGRERKLVVDDHVNMVDKDKMDTKVTKDQERSRKKGEAKDSDIESVTLNLMKVDTASMSQGDSSSGISSDHTNISEENKDSPIDETPQVDHEISIIDIESETHASNLAVAKDHVSVSNSSFLRAKDLTSVSSGDPNTLGATSDAQQTSENKDTGMKDNKIQTGTSDPDLDLSLDLSSLVKNAILSKTKGVLSRNPGSSRPSLAATRIMSYDIADTRKTPYHGLEKIDLKSNQQGLTNVLRKQETVDSGSGLPDLRTRPKLKKSVSVDRSEDTVVLSDSDKEINIFQKSDDSDSESSGDGISPTLPSKDIFKDSKMQEDKIDRFIFKSSPSHFLPSVGGDDSETKRQMISKPPLLWKNSSDIGQRINQRLGRVSTLPSALSEEAKDDDLNDMEANVPHKSLRRGSLGDVGKRINNRFLNLSRRYSGFDELEGEVPDDSGITITAKKEDNNNNSNNNYNSGGYSSRCCNDSNEDGGDLCNSNCNNSNCNTDSNVDESTEDSVWNLQWFQSPVERGREICAVVVTTGNTRDDSICNRNGLSVCDSIDDFCFGLHKTDEDINGSLLQTRKEISVVTGADTDLYNNSAYIWKSYNGNSDSECFCDSVKDNNRRCLKEAQMVSDSCTNQGISEGLDVRGFCLCEVNDISQMGDPHSTVCGHCCMKSFRVSLVQ